jgi:hypothetical protein
MKSQELDVVERSTTSETVEEPIIILGVRKAGDVGALGLLIISPTHHKW